MNNSKDSTTFMIVALTVIVILLSLSIVLKAVAMKNTSLSGSSEKIRTITVTGSAETQKMPDIIRLSVSVSKLAETSKEAQNGANEMMQRIISIAKDDFHVYEEDIFTDYISISPSYSWKDGKQVLLGQKATQDVTVTLRNTDSLSALIDALVSVDGILISGVEGDLSDRNAQLAVARELAVSDARKKAMDYAEALGATLGNALKVTDNSPSYLYLTRAAAKSFAMANDSDEGYAETQYFADPVVSSAIVEVVFVLNY